MTQAQAIKMLYVFLERFDTKSAGIRELNSILATRYDVNYLGQWRRGERPVPKVVTGFLIGVAEVLKD